MRNFIIRLKKWRFYKTMYTKKIRPIDIAKKLNISTSSLRNYETRGIVPPTERSSSGYRIYTEEHIAFFECIIAMAPGFGMEITSDVLMKLQRKELESALWIINKAQANNYDDKVLAENAMKLLENLNDEINIMEKYMTIDDVSKEAQIPATTLRHWEKEGLISPKRDLSNNYRLFDKFQLIKILLIKTTQNVIYSAEVITLKKAIKDLKEYDFQKTKKIVADIQKILHNGIKNNCMDCFTFTNCVGRLTYINKLASYKEVNSIR